MRHIPGLLALLLVLSGCTGDAHENTVARASKPFVSHGWAYDGTGAATNGFVNIATSDRSNTGSVVAQWSDAELGLVELSWSQFGAGADFQSGGIVRGLDAHGATGRGDTNLPRVHYVSAGWGFGELRVNKTLLENPITQDTTYKMHYMLLRDAVRDAKTRQITKSDGATLFDPRSPDDGRTLPAVPQILVHIRANGSVVPPHINKTYATRSSVGGGGEFGLPVEVPRLVGRLRLIVNATGPPPPTPAPWQASFRLLDPDGTQVGPTRTLGGVVRSVELAADLPVAGRWSLRSTEAGPVSYNVTRILEFPRLVPLERVLTFDDVIISHGGASEESR